MSVPQPLRKTMAAVAAATVVLSLLGGDALVRWSNNLPPGPVTDGVARAAGAWSGLVAPLGGPALAGAVHDGLERIRTSFRPDPGV